MRRGLDDAFAFAWSLRNNNISIPRALLGENRICDCPNAKARGMVCAHEPKANTNLCEHCTEDHAWNYLGEQCTCECEHCADNHHGQCTTRCNAMTHRQLWCNCTCIGCDPEQGQVGPDSGELTDPVADGAKRQKTTASQDATTDEGQSTHSCSRSCTHGPHFQFRKLSSGTCVPCSPRPAEGGGPWPRRASARSRASQEGIGRRKRARADPGGTTLPPPFLFSIHLSKRAFFPRLGVKVNKCVVYLAGGEDAKKKSKVVP